MAGAARPSREAGSGRAASRAWPEPVELAAVGEAPDWPVSFGHLTVMGPEAVEALAVRPAGLYVDATLGGGGHSRLILSALGPEGRLVALDRDPEPRRWASAGWGRKESRLTVAAGDFGRLAEILAELGLGAVDGLLADLGLNSRQLLASKRGFSWASDDPLDMRFDPEGPVTAREVVNTYSEKALAELIWRYGEERAARRIARGLVWAREKEPIETSGRLAQVVARSLWRPGPPPRLHPATRTFMALRIEVNQELAALESLLAAAEKLVRPGGRLVVISFHSLEDRRVKEALKKADETGRPVWRPIYKKPLTPSVEETAANPRARSAKLRAATRI